MKIRLRRGEEPVELNGKRLLVGIGTKACAPGETATMVVRPQLSGRTLTILVDRRTAEAFELYDLRVGKCSQFVSTNSVPLHMFAVDVEHLPDAQELRVVDEQYREFFDLDVCPVGTDLLVIVTNTSDEPADFRGAIAFLCAE